MISSVVAKTAGDIKSLRIQGASRIARVGLRALATQARASAAKSREAWRAELERSAAMLSGSRPTEPMLRNSLRLLLRAADQPAPLPELKKGVDHMEAFLLAKFESNIHKIAEFGANELPKNPTVLIHCHSNTLMAVLKKAKAMGKKPNVICTESRPFYQGHISARELAAAKIPVTMIVDDAVKSFIHEADVAMVGADAVTSTGDLINKIGTSTIAAICFESQVPFYSTTELLKFDPETLWGKLTKIEERDVREVADPRKFRGVKIRNPAFDITHAKYIEGYVTEKGVLSPQGLLTVAMKEFGYG